MTFNHGSEARNRNRNFEDTHRLLIDSASDLIDKRGAGAVSIAALARVTRINRSTVYYHFDTREALVSAAQSRSAERLAKSMEAEPSRWVGIDHISGFFRSNPDVVASWIDDFVVIGDIRQRHPEWDRLVEQIGDAFAELPIDEPCDPDIYCALMLAGAFHVAREFSPPTHPFESLERILERLHGEASAKL